MAKKWPDKDPDEVLDYAYNWSPRKIGSDIIVTPTAIVVEPSEGAEDIVVDSTDVADAGQLAKYNIEETEDARQRGVPPSLALAGQLQIVWLSKGIERTKRSFRLHAVTSSGRELDDTVKITIKER